MKSALVSILDKLPNNSTRFLVSILILLSVVIVMVGVPLSNNFTTIYIRQQDIALELKKDDIEELHFTVTALERSLLGAYIRINELERTIEEQKLLISELMITMETVQDECGR